MIVPPKPRTGKRVFSFFILYYTIVDYVWVDPSHKLCRLGILKPGWMPIKKYNYKHPIQKAFFKSFKKAQEDSRKNQQVDWNKLDKIRITI